MPRALKKIDPDVHFRVLHLLEEEPNLTQREVAERLGISLGGVNYCLKSLIDVGHIKTGNFKRNPDKSPVNLIIGDTFSPHLRLAKALKTRKVKVTINIKDFCFMFSLF